MDDDLFEPRLGWMRAPSSRRGRRYLVQVLRSAGRAGAGLVRKGRAADCGRIGRGAGIGRLLASRDRFAGLRSRRAIVKTRLVRLKGRGLGAARAHLRYIQRDGMQRDGSRGLLYSAGEDRADGKLFLDRCDGDRHQFRLIVSAEDGADYDDLRPLVRRFMAQMEKDLGTRLDWVAADHVDTARPHTHIILRGRDELGQNLIIAREYISRGMRERVAELVTLDLGPRQDAEIRQKLRREISAERLTSIDRRLIGDLGDGGTLAAGHRDPFQHALRLGRLEKLKSLGLAEELGGGRWKLDMRLDDELRAMGERGDIIRTMQRALRANELERSPGDRIVHARGGLDRPVIGQVVERGLSDEISDRHYLIVDGLDGRVHHIDIGRGDLTAPTHEGSIVRVSPAAREMGQADRTVAAIASANGGRYSIDLHFNHDRSASLEFAQAHVRRLEAIRRGGGPVKRFADGSWAIAPDHLHRVAAHEEKTRQTRPVRVDLLSVWPLEQLVDAEAATWIDRQLVAGEPEPCRDAGFGRQLRSALAVRRQWLVDEGFASNGPDGPVYRKDMLEGLRRRDLLRVAARIADEVGVPYLETPSRGRVAGTLERRLDLASGQFAVIVNSHEFMMVPWRDSLEPHIGRELQVTTGSSGINWTIGRGRAGPEIG